MKKCNWMFCQSAVFGFVLCTISCSLFARNPEVVQITIPDDGSRGALLYAQVDVSDDGAWLAADKALFRTRDGLMMPLPDRWESDLAIVAETNSNPDMLLADAKILFLDKNLANHLESQAIYGLRQPFSYTGRYFAALFNSTLVVVDVTNGKLLAKKEGVHNGIGQILVCSDGKSALLTQSGDERVNRWTFGDDLLWPLRQPQMKWLSSAPEICIFNSGKSCARIEGEKGEYGRNSQVILNTFEGRICNTIPSPYVSAIEVMPDGRGLLLGYVDGRVRLFPNGVLELERGRLPSESSLDFNVNVRNKELGGIYKIAASRDGNTVAALSREHRIAIARLNTPQDERKPTSPLLPSIGTHLVYERTSTGGADVQAWTVNEHVAFGGATTFHCLGLTNNLNDDFHIGINGMKAEVVAIHSKTVFGSEPLCRADLSIGIEHMELINPTSDRQITIQYHGMETVTVPAGTFNTHRTSWKSNYQGGVASGACWYAEGVGIVKRSVDGDLAWAARDKKGSTTWILQSVSRK